MRIGEILIGAGLLTPEQLARGLDAQLHSGGRLGTNLVELGFITERQLAGTLSEQLGLPYVSAEMVANISPSLIARVPLDVASEYRAFPITVKGRVLHVCMADPTNLEKLDALSFRLSCSIQPCVVTELTLNYALERYYGLRREPRFMYVKPESSMPAAFVQITEEKGSQANNNGMSREEFLAAESGESFSLQTDGFTAIASALAEARNEDEIVQCIKQFFATILSQNVILSLLGSSLVPITETGLGIDPQALPSMSIPLRNDSILPAAIRDLNLHFHWDVTDPTLLLLCQKTGMEPHELTVVPIMHHHTVRFLVVGRGADLPTLKRHLPTIKRALSKLSCALQIQWLRKQILESVEPCQNAPFQVAV